jgi:hypothetical protein
MRTVNEQLSAYLDGELDQHAASQLESELAVDATLAEEARRLQEVDALFHKTQARLQGERCVDGLAALRGRLAREDAEFKAAARPLHVARGSWLRWPGYTLAGAMALTMAFYFWPHTGQDDRPQTAVKTPSSAVEDDEAAMPVSAGSLEELTYVMEPERLEAYAFIFAATPVEDYEVIEFLDVATP